MLASIFDNSSHEQCPKHFNLAAYVLLRADELKDKIAFSILSPEKQEDWTYKDLKAAILSTAYGLLELGPKPNEKLVLHLGNTVDFPIIYLAAIAVGIYPIPISFQLTMDDLQKLCTNLSPSAVCADPDIRFPKTNAMIQILLSHLNKMRNLSPAKFKFGSPDRLAYLVLTSGTSGSPKVGNVCSSSNLGKANDVPRLV